MLSLLSSIIFVEHEDAVGLIRYAVVRWAVGHTVVKQSGLLHIIILSVERQQALNRGNTASVLCVLVW